MSFLWIDACYISVESSMAHGIEDGHSIHEILQSRTSEEGCSRCAVCVELVMSYSVVRRDLQIEEKR